MSKYWYKIFIEECVLCGRIVKYKERQYSEKPKEYDERIIYTQSACSNHFI